MAQVGIERFELRAICARRQQVPTKLHESSCAARSGVDAAEKFLARRLDGERESRESSRSGGAFVLLRRAADGCWVRRKFAAEQLKKLGAIFGAHVAIRVNDLLSDGCLRSLAAFRKEATAEEGHVGAMTVEGLEKVREEARHRNYNYRRSWLPQDER